MERKTIIYYNSLKRDGSEYLNGVLQYLEAEWNDTNKIACFDNGKWEIKTHSDKLNIQENHYDCGIFTILYAEFITQKREINFHQKDIEDDIREKLVYCLLNNKRLINWN